ncbi:hypothetical protein VTO42DRAFT_385 [Malbranchea cinnamomea]
MRPAFRVSTVREAANVLLANRDDSTSPPTVCECWVNRFINRHPEIKTRAKCEDPKVIRQWFELVQNTIQKYGVVQKDIYNFDETGFQMGFIGTAKVVTGSERALRPKLVQPGNTEWVTIVEEVNATGWSLPPMVILKGKWYQASWYENGPPET